MNIKTLILSSLIAAASFIFVSPVQAATTCTPIYGGGQNCVTTVVQPTAQPQVTTKGGLKVFPAAPVEKTPATGPEDIALVGLFSSGIIGYILNKYISK